MKENMEEEKLRLKEFMEWQNDFSKRYKLKANTLRKRMKYLILYLKEFVFSMIIRILFCGLLLFLGIRVIIYFSLPMVFSYFLSFLLVVDFMRRFILTRRYIGIMEKILNSL